MTADEWRLSHSLRSWLPDRGYRLVATEDRHGMDVGFDAYEGRVARIEIAADRGQWFVEVIPNGAPRGRYDMECWSHALGEPRLFHSESIEGSWRLEPQLEYFQEKLADIEAASDPDRRRATLDKLASAAHATAAFPARRPGRAAREPRDIKRR